MIRIASLTLVAGAVLLLTWALTPATARQRPRDAAPHAAESYQAAEPMLTEVSAQVARLRERLDRLPEFGRPTRDPFRRGGSRSAPPPPVNVEPVVAPAAAPALPRLIAILSDRLAESPVRRAALSVDGVVRILAAGELIGTMRVARVDADAVELVDPATGATFRLTLR